MININVATMLGDNQMHMDHSFLFATAEKKKKTATTEIIAYNQNDKQQNQSSISFALHNMHRVTRLPFSDRLMDATSVCDLRISVCL